MRFSWTFLSTSFLLLTLFINWSNAIVGFVHRVYFHFLFLIVVTYEICVFFEGAKKEVFSSI
jgi:hypothetical protein